MRNRIIVLFVAVALGWSLVGCSGGLFQTTGEDTVDDRLLSAQVVFNQARQRLLNWHDRGTISSETFLEASRITERAHVALETAWDIYFGAESGDPVQQLRLAQKKIRQLRQLLKSERSGSPDTSLWDDMPDLQKPARTLEVRLRGVNHGGW